MRSVLRRLIPSPRTTRGKLGIVAFLTTFAMLAGTSAAVAYWTSTSSPTSTVSAASLTLGTTNFTSVAYTFANDTLTTTGSVTVTNTTTTTSTQSGSVSLTFGPNAATTMAGKVSLTVWPTSDASTCTTSATVPSGATTALWSASPSVSTPLALTATASYCLRSTVASRESVAIAGGTMNFSPKITGTITVGNFTGSTTATVTQATQYIYPAYTSQSTTDWSWIKPNYTPNGVSVCTDVNGGFSAPNTQIISWACNVPGKDNQLWKFTQSSVPGYYTITPKNAPALRLDNQNSTYYNSIVAGTASSATGQLWQLQVVSPGVYQIVNAYSGQCLNPGKAGANYSQWPCNGQASQQYYISPAFNSFGCSVSSTNFVWSWTSVANGPYKVMITSGSTTTQLATTTGATATGVTVPYSALSTYSNATYGITFVDPNGTVVGSGSIVKGATIGASSCTADVLTS